MTEEKALLAAVDDASWDDVSARLVYADWLDEHDRPEEANEQRRQSSEEYLSSVKWLREYAVQNKPYDAACKNCYGSGHDWRTRRGANEPYPRCPTCSGSGKPQGDHVGVAYQCLLEEWKDKTVFYHGRDLHSRGDLDDELELRHHMAIVTGAEVSEDEFEEFSFTCSC